MASRQTAIVEQPKFTEFNDLCSERNGSCVLFATDDWFAVAENLIKAEEPEWHEGEFTECGKWMDGWETRRKRTAGHDWAVIRLGVPGVVHGVMIDTAYFTGNYPVRFSLQAASLRPEEEKLIPQRISQLGGTATDKMIEQIEKLKSEDWQELVPRSFLQPGYHDSRYNYFAVDNDSYWTHVRLNLYPDGGIARMRIYGEACPQWDNAEYNTSIDLLSMKNGGLCMGYSDAHYGHPRNVIQPGSGINMADGWETARRLDRPSVLKVDENNILQMHGSEWAIFRLGHAGWIHGIEVDTRHFKGNYPDSIQIEGSMNWTPSSPNAIWKSLLPPQKLSPHKQHFYSEAVLAQEKFSHVRVTITPDGGISRVRLWGSFQKKGM